MIDPPVTDREPDHSTCRHCGDTITWDEVCYTHDSNGMADCGLYIVGGERLPESMAGVGTVALIDPSFLAEPDHAGHRAEPVEWNDE
jgi:hypothetical protein